MLKVAGQFLLRNRDGNAAAPGVTIVELRLFLSLNQTLNAAYVLFTIACHTIIP